MVLFFVRFSASGARAQKSLFAEASKSPLPPTEADMSRDQGCKFGRIAFDFGQSL